MRRTSSSSCVDTRFRKLALGALECQPPGDGGRHRDGDRRSPTVHDIRFFRKGVHVTTATMNKVAIKPLEDRIVVQANEAETTTASGIVIPDTAKEKPQEGTVIAVGPGRFEDGARVPLDVSVGDTVIYSKYGGTEVKYAGEDYLVLSARDVLAIVEK
jgi:chaperonin GroES